VSLSDDYVPSLKSSEWMTAVADTGRSAISGTAVRCALEASIVGTSTEWQPLDVAPGIGQRLLLEAVKWNSRPEAAMR